MNKAEFITQYVLNRATVVDNFNAEHAAKDAVSVWEHHIDKAWKEYHEERTECSRPYVPFTDTTEHY